MWLYAKQNCISWLKSALGTHKCVASKIWGRFFSTEVLAAITLTFDSPQEHLCSGPSPGEPQAASRVHRGTPSWKALRDKGFAQPPTSTAGWRVWEKLLKWVTHNSYSSICLTLFSTLHLTAVQLINLFLWFWFGWSDVNPELLWALPLETEASVNKALWDYFSLACLVVWKWHKVISLHGNDTIFNFLHTWQVQKDLEISAQVMKNSR